MTKQKISVKWVSMTMMLVTLFLLSACTKPVTVQPMTNISNPQISLDGPDVIGNDKVILIIDEWAPFTSQTMDGYGMCSELVTAAMNAVNLKCEYQFRPWARALEMTRYGDAWGTFPWRDVSERREIYLYSEPLIKVKSVLFYKKNNSNIVSKIPEYKNIQELKDYRFGGVFGYYYEGIFKEGNFDYDLATSLDGAFQMMESGKTDLIIEDEAVGWYTLEKLYPGRMDEFSTLVNHIDQNEMFMLVNKTDPQAAIKLEKFNEGLKIIRENGIYESIVKKYNVER